MQGVIAVVKREGFLVLCHAYSNPAFHQRSRPAVVEAFRSFHWDSASQMAKAEGYDWDDTQFAHSWYDQAADRLHAEDPEKYYSSDESPEDDSESNEPFSDELPKYLQSWLRDVRKATRHMPEQRALADSINMLADKLANIHADADVHQKGLLKAIGTATNAAWAAAIIAAVIALRLLFH
jgi:hypothetical protein